MAARGPYTYPRLQRRSPGVAPPAAPRRPRNRQFGRLRGWVRAVPFLGSHRRRRPPLIARLARARPTGLPLGLEVGPRKELLMRGHVGSG